MPENQAKPKNEPAFPCEYINQSNETVEGFYGADEIPAGITASYAGMSLRDYFAAEAVKAPHPILVGNYDQLAKAAYKLADAMLAARNA